MNKLFKALKILFKHGPFELAGKTKKYYYEQRKKRLVGLLYDSIYQNTGDKAMGLVMSKFLSKNNTPFEIINPLAFNPNRYKTIIIGGGHLIRDKAKSYYDIFRLPGQNILNTMGLSTKQDLEYLEKYLYVSVRSQNDKQLLPAGLKAKVVPCVSMNLEPKRFEHYYQEKPILGVHIMQPLLDLCPNLLEILNSIKDIPKIFIPVTFYNDDYRLMADFSRRSGIPILPLLSPGELLYFISTLSYLICSSLHATIWAYMTNVPFLSMYQPKVDYFLKDRGLEKYIFSSELELKEKLPLILNQKADFTEKIYKDRMDLSEHFYTIKQLL